MPDESFAVRRKIGLERGYDGRQYAADALTHGSSLIEHLQSSIQYRVSSIGHRNSERIDSFAPAHLKLVRFPARSPLPWRLYLLGRFPQKLHSASRLAHLCRSRPRGSI